MRIVAGERKGMRLDAPTGRGTRPTSDRLRETLFSVLGDVGGLHVLDAFAGSGALGLEALSGGAERAEFWETSSGALRVLRGNIDRLGYSDRAVVRRRDAGRGMAQDAGARVTYQLILLDPPYTMLPALQEIFSLHLPQLLVSGGLAVLESASGDPPPGLPLTIETTRIHGAARLTVYANG